MGESILNHNLIMLNDIKKKIFFFNVEWMMKEKIVKILLPLKSWIIIGDKNRYNFKTLKKNLKRVFFSF